MSRMNQQQFYSDVDLHFNVHPINNDISVLYDDKSIKQQIYNILTANYGDVKFHPEKTVGIRDTLFEPISIITETELKIKISHILKQWMPRISLNRIEVEINKEYDGYDVFVYYITLNILEEQETTLFLSRIR